MNSLGRISLLFGALILLVFGIICLKQQMISDPAQDDLVSPDTAGTHPDASEFPAQQPMILSNSGVGDQSVWTRPVELSPVQLSGNHAEQWTTPTHAPLLNGPMNAHSEQRRYPDSEPFRRGSSTEVSAAVLLAPVAVNSDPTEGTAADDARTFNSATGGAPADDRVSAEDGAAKEVTASEHTLPQTVVTVADDSLWNISKRLYGRGDFYKALWLHNQSVIPRPDRILPGIRLVAPNVDELRQLYPDACPASMEDSAPNS